MIDLTTFTVSPEDPLDDFPERLRKAAEELAEMAKPRLAGEFMGFPVYVSGTMPDGEVEIRGTHQTVRFRLDDPRIDGTDAQLKLLCNGQSQQKP